MSGKSGIKTNEINNNGANKTVLITGVTGAIGGAAAMEIAKTGVKTIILGRDKQRLQSAKENIVKKTGNENVEIILADFSDISSIKKAVKNFNRKNDNLSALINVAAVFKNKRELSKDGLEMMYAVNYLAPFILTNSLLDLLKKSKSARIINITAPSKTKLNFADLQGNKGFSALNAFGASKMANLLFTYALANRLEGSNVAVSAFFPGLVKSDLMKEMPKIMNIILKLIAGSPEKAGHFLSMIALNPEFKNSNAKFFKYNGKEIISSQYSHSIEIQERLWKISEEFY